MFIKRISSVVLMSLLLVACGSVGAAQGQARRMSRLKRLLTLNDAQVSDIGALQKKHRDAALPLRQALRVNNRDLRNALDATEPNTNSIGRLVVDRRGIRKQLQSLNVKFRKDLAAVLTPEQKQKFEQLRPWRNARKGRA